MPTMKWWGWGEEGIAFTHRDKPALAPFIHQSIGVDVRVNGAAPISFDQLRIPEPNLPAELRPNSSRRSAKASSRAMRSIASSTRAESRCAT